MFTSLPRRVRLNRRLSRVLAGVLAAFVLMVGLTLSANAAVDQPGISLSVQMGVVTVKGVGFPENSQVTVVGSVVGGAGQGTVMSDSKGAFILGIQPPDWQSSDSMVVTAKSGNVSAQATISLRNSSVLTPDVATPSTITSQIKEPASDTRQPMPEAIKRGPVPNGPTGNWKLVFGDDFSGTSLDTSKWATCFHWGCKGANPVLEKQTYKPGNVKVGGGKVSLMVTDNGSASGMIAANQKTAIKYGYLEMRAQMPKCRGCWPAFWTVPDDLSWPPEIDIAEGLDPDSAIVSTNYHYKGTGEDAQSGAKRFDSSVDLASGYHTYGALWTASSITWYIDGKVANTYSDASNMAKVPMYVIANLAIDPLRGSGSAAPGGAQMNIDYIRVFQQ